ncbi:hypothetical protein RclHR1_03800005 [Rhizophagus clarus]|uniref:Uncharacterized protein n=1 Tax=Rhizophagus clarus TaxID=94130 RepID=A0A2Z6S7T2_9GLOM|nr:hypothetical protein RclHR1_03800005 [Rhizophagus clarus]
MTVPKQQLEVDTVVKFKYPSKNIDNAEGTITKVLANEDAFIIKSDVVDKKDKETRVKWEDINEIVR